MKLGSQRNQCPACREYFNSTSAFEKHRIGEFGVNRRCLTVDEMKAKGMKKNKDKFWVSESMPEGKKFWKDKK